MNLEDLLNALADIEGNDGEIAGLQDLAHTLWEHLPEEQRIETAQLFEGILQDAKNTQF
ncbi:hypothetical protein OpiT1DRAFT_05655 [Opitutaceae bacterium TAV1]|nr:hypothetical protein OpiT1DRAFT_05655 [Opitutaceae bacterium TAV1]